MFKTYRYFRVERGSHIDTHLHVLDLAAQEILETFSEFEWQKKLGLFDLHKVIVKSAGDARFKQEAGIVLLPLMSEFRERAEKDAVQELFPTAMETYLSKSLHPEKFSISCSLLIPDSFPNAGAILEKNWGIVAPIKSNIAINLHHEDVRVRSDVSNPHAAVVTIDQQSFFPLARKVGDKRTEEISWIFQLPPEIEECGNTYKPPCSSQMAPDDVRSLLDGVDFEQYPLHRYHTLAAKFVQLPSFIVCVPL